MGQRIDSNNSQPRRLYTAAQVRAMDSFAITTLGVNSYGLMRTAARATLAALLRRWPAPSRLVCYCGVGNNGGDGFAVAAMARQRGLTVLVALLGDSAKLSDDARTAYQWAVDSGVPIQAAEHINLAASDTVVDAMLGTGQQAAPRATIAAAIAAINNSGAQVCAVDVPTGVCADTGRCLGADAVRAQLTVTFIGLKRGLCTHDGAGFSGDIVFDDLGVPPAAIASQPSEVQLVHYQDYKQQLPTRWANSHKGHFGHVLVVGGNSGCGGAALLAARAAARAGAGLVSVATKAEHLAAYLASQPELMVHAVASEADVAPLVAAATVIVVGPGLGRDAWAQQLLAYCLAAAKPVLIDADGLNLVVQTKPLLGHNVVLTPHPGEAARLLDTTVAAVQANRFDAAATIQARWGGVCVLKGAGTVVAGVAEQFVIPTGNSGMAAGGSGDVLSGIIGGLIAQQFNTETAAWLGAYIHGLAGDIAAADGQRGMLASDLTACLRRVMNPTHDEF